MLSNGADGQTLTGLLSALSLTKNSADLSAANSLYGKLLFGLPLIDETTSTNIANAVWLSNELTVKDDFLATTKNDYQSDVFTIDFSLGQATSQINEWVSEQTNGMIKNAALEVSKNANLCLANATYFKGKWTAKFNKTKTTEFSNDNGSVNTVGLMNNSASYAYYQAPDFEYLAVPFGHEDFEFDIILPNESKSLNDVIANLDFATFDNAAKSAIYNYEYIDLAMPKISQECRYDLSGLISEMGASEAFSATPNFSKLSDKQFPIGAVQHCTAINLDETGAEVAGSTVVGPLTSDGSGTTATPREFTVNRPFVYIIREHNSNVIMFIGAIYNL